MSAPNFEKMAEEILDGREGREFWPCVGGLRKVYEAGARDERAAVITKLCHEHVREDDLIAWLRARGEGNG